MEENALYIKRRDAFVKFLYKHQAFGKYIIELHRKENAYKRVIRELSLMREELTIDKSHDYWYSILTMSFAWKYTEDGFNFWSELNKEWKHYYNFNLTEHPYINPFMH